MLLDNEKNCKIGDRFKKKKYINTVICHKHVILQAKIPYLTICIFENSAQKLIHTCYHNGKKKMKN